MADSATSFDFNLIGAADKPFLGYVSSKDKTDVSAQVLVKGSKNVFKKLSGTIAKRPGLKRRGTADATDADTKSSYEWYTSLGALRVMRVNNGKLQVESDIVTSGTYVWYDLMTALTLTRFVFDSWWNNTLKKDELIFVKGDTNLHMWHGGMGLIASTTVNTIVLTANATTSGFATSGSVLINGNTYTYSGISGSTLTGVGTNPTGEAANSVVVSTVVTTATTPAATFTNDFLKVVANQLYVGSYTSRLTYISDDSDYTNYTVPGTRAAGDPELLTLDAAGKGIGLRAGKAHIFAGTSFLHVVNFTDITVGSTLVQRTDAPRQDLANLQAALAHEFIDSIGDSLVYLSQDNQLVTYGTFRNINQPKFPTLSLPIRDELIDEDFSGGHLRTTGEFIYITAPLSGTTYLHQTRENIDAFGNITAERLWHPPQIWNVSRIAVIDGVEYGHSNANPQMYQLWNTNQWHDDSPNLGDDGEYENLPYEAIMRMAYRSSGRRQGLTSFDKVLWEGYMTQGSDVNSYVLSEYQGAGGVQNPNISSPLDPAQFFSAEDPFSIGDSSIGVNPLGDTLTEDDSGQELLPKFRAITDIDLVNCFEYQLVAYSTDLDSRWEMLCLGPNAQIADNEQATFLRK